MAGIQFLCPIIFNYSETIAKELLELGEKTNAQVDFQPLNWGEAWTSLMKASLYGREPDVAGIGSSWISDFAGMNSLRPFTQDDIRKIGSPDSFLHSNWLSCLANGQVWSIPWAADTRLLYYRRDILEKVGLDEQTAFTTHDALDHTLERIKQYGYPVPFAIPTQITRMTLQYMSSWVWEAGGEFITANGQRTLFNSPGIRLGMLRYFSLGKYLAPPAQLLSESQSDDIFVRGEAAVILSGSWLMRNLTGGFWSHEHRWGARLPRIPYMGGTNLVIYRSSQQVAKALDLIRFLTSSHLQEVLLDLKGLLPVRQSVYQSERVTRDPFYSAISQGIQHSRVFPSFHLWGLVEDRTTRAFAQIWRDMFLHPGKSVETILDEHIPPLVHELEQDQKTD